MLAYPRALSKINLEMNIEWLTADFHFPPCVTDALSYALLKHQRRKSSDACIYLCKCLYTAFPGKKELTWFSVCGKQMKI